jgi:hypothetical protein
VRVPVRALVDQHGAAIRTTDLEAGIGHDEILAVPDQCYRHFT